ncbi:MAG: exodeoxyribonuclease VII small subunit [Rugosibacter sp.]|jgi:exodeoxyribonuclease VII small subunit|nr:exodeoxyribonuclease VII small subunit [Rugosibacter sp.]
MKTPPKESSALIESPSFEESLRELETIISAMEVGQMPLQEALDTYKRGISLLHQCQDTLSSAEQQIRILEANTLRPFTADPAGERENNG